MSTQWNTRLTLIERARNPLDESAWEDFVTYYYDFIKAVLFNMSINSNDVEDLVQVILLALWKSLPEMKYEKGKARFRTWLSKIIKFKAIDYIRKSVRNQNKQTKIINEAELIEENLLGTELETMIMEEWRVYVVETAIKRISCHFSSNALQAFTRSMKGEPTAIIAQDLGIKNNSVIKLRNRFKQRLSEEIEDLKWQYEFSD